MPSEIVQRLARVSATVLTLLWSAMLTARGATQLLASALAKEDKTVPAQLVAADVRPPSSSLEIGSAVLERNIFDSQTGAMAWDAAALVRATEMGGKDAGVLDPQAEPSTCVGSLRLVGTIVPRLPDLSLASISTEGKALLYQAGMRVEGHEVIGIRPHRVLLRPSGRPLCQIGMFVPPPSATPAAAVPPADEKLPAPKGSIGEAELNQGITQLGDTSYAVSRALLDQLLSAQSELMRVGRVMPYEENGRTVGVKIYGVRRTGLLGKLGIQNGDILRTLNGFDLSSPDSALEAYTKLRELDQFSLALIRHGQPRTIQYSIR